MSFDTLIADAQSFCRALAADNSKSFWEAHRSTYDTRLKSPALALLDAVAPALSDMTGETVAPKLFRPNRDVRFSADKRPYKEHLHMIWHIKAGGRQDPGYFFGVGIDYVTVGAGIMVFDKPVLDDWRKFIDLDSSRLTPIFERLDQAGWAFWEPELKRVPSGFDPGHPLERFLRMKGAVCARPLDHEGPLEKRIMEAFAEVRPFADLLTSVACA